MTPNTQEDKLDAILVHLQNLDRRDRLRTWGGFFRGIISILPVLVFLYAAWYTTQHFNEILQTIASETAKQTAAAAAQIQLPNGISLEQLKGLMK